MAHSKDCCFFIEVALDLGKCLHADIKGRIAFRDISVFYSGMHAIGISKTKESEGSATKPYL